MLLGEERQMAAFPGLSHVALTVTDLAVSAPWYERLFGVKPVLDEDAGAFYHVVYPLAGGLLLGLHDHRKANKYDRFDEYRPGLDQVAFGCATRKELKTWQARLEEGNAPRRGGSRIRRAGQRRGVYAGRSWAGTTSLVAWVSTAMEPSDR
jgi:glyoxylase I family protein